MHLGLQSWNSTNPPQNPSVIAPASSSAAPAAVPALLGGPGRCPSLGDRHRLLLLFTRCLLSLLEQGLRL